MFYHDIESKETRDLKENNSREGTIPSRVRWEDERYENWIARLEDSYEKGEVFDYNPKISVIVPVYNVQDRYLIPCIESVLSQTYGNWELCLADDGSTFANIRPALEKYKDISDRIKVAFRGENGGISEATNTALKMATGEYVAFLDCDDTLAPFALYEVVKYLSENSETDFIYSDEDKINDSGTHRHSPFFKPDWSPDTLLSMMYTCHLGVYRKSIVDRMEGLKTEYNGAQDYDFVLRFTELTDKIAHIPKILYHWRERVGSTSQSPEAKDYVKEATFKCKMAALQRRSLPAGLEYVDQAYHFRVNYDTAGNPFVSVIIPSKDHPDVLNVCLSSLAAKTEYKNYEIIVIDNGSIEENKEKYRKLTKQYNAEYIYEPMDFNYPKMCNMGAELSKGEYLLFLNDDVEIIEGKWLSRMLGQAQQQHVGAVGAKLLYPNSTMIQHDGVTCIEIGPVHAFQKLDDSKLHYFYRNVLDYNVLAVTGACFLIKKSKFYEVSCFDESLPVAYNDVDLCFKLVEYGYYNVIRNDAVLFHYESLSRGYDEQDKKKFLRLMGELKKLYKNHPQFKKSDPCYNENLTQSNCDYSFNYEKNFHYECLEVDEKEILDSFPSSDRILGYIDVMRCDLRLRIEGWAFKAVKGFNPTEKPWILLSSMDHKDCRSYLIETHPVLRMDVAEYYKIDKLRYCGWKINLETDTIPVGEYKISILLSDERRDFKDILVVW